jgi:threonine/homoserine/homoserine lactone efflux protein
MDLTVLGVPIAFLWTAFVIELTPGPNMTYLAILSLTEGRRAGFAALAGVATGLLLAGLIAALGLAAVVSESRVLYNLLRWGGVLYLLWLAFDIWTGGEGDPAAADIGANSLLTYFRRGLITNLLNPKAAMFYVTVLPAFINPDGPVLPQTFAMTLAYVAVATAVHTGIVAAAATARPLLENTVKMRTLRRTMALAVVVVAAWLVWSTRSPNGG